MLCSIFGGLVLLQLVSAGGYAPPPPVQPSASAYGSPQSFGYGHNSYGSQPLPLVEGGSVPVPVPVPAPVPPPPTVPVPVSPAQVYNYPIQSNQGYGAAPASATPSVYNDIIEVTTLPSLLPSTSSFIPPIVEQVDEAEKYGVPEILPSVNANPSATVIPVPQPVPVAAPAVVSQGGYAPPPLVSAAPSAYGAPPPTPAPYGGATYNQLEYNAGEVPTAVVQPGNVPSPVAPPSPYRVRAIRSQKKTAEARKKHF